MSERDEQSLFLQALALDPAERAAFLDEACEGDAHRRARIEALIVAHEGGGSFMEFPAGATSDIGANQTESEFIFVYEGNEIVRTRLGPGVYTVGRGQEANIEINSESLSRQHARLFVDRERIVLQDLDSSNGTFVDGRRLQQPEPVGPGQSIALGNVHLTIESCADVAAPLVERGESVPLPGELQSETKYSVGDVVARGGMGAIRTATQCSMRRNVAMKVMLHTADEQSLSRFINEAQITGQLEHPNIVPVHELGVDEHGQVFYTMKFVQGVTLGDVLSRLAEGDAKAIAEFPLPVLLTIFQKVCDAVAFAHSKEVIHRDLKPANIMVGDFGEVLVMDWGIAKIQATMGGNSAEAGEEFSDASTDPSAEALTAAGSVLGTPGYMSPEQARGEIEALDARTDGFALGRILFEILYLKPALSGASSFEIIEKAARGERDPVSVVASAHLPDRKVPLALAAVCDKAMAPDPTARYASVEELQSEVSAYQGGFATSAQEAGLLTQLRLLINRHRGISGSVAASVILLVVLSGLFVAGIMRERDQAEQARDFAEEETAKKEALLSEKVSLLEKVNEGELALAQKVLDLERKNEELQREKAVVAGAKADLKSAGSTATRVADRIPAIRAAQEELLAELSDAYDELAKAQVREGKLMESVESARRALRARPDDRRFALGVGNRLQWAGQFAEAARFYEQALGSETDPQIERLLELARRSEQEVKDRGGISEETLAEHKKVMAELGEIEQSAAAIRELAKITKGSTEEETRALQERLALKERVLAALQELRAQEKWNDERVTVHQDKTIAVDLSGLSAANVPDLRSFNVTWLKISGSGFKDLGNIRGLPLTWLKIDSNSENLELSHIRGMPLEFLSLWGNKGIQDFSPISTLTTLKDLRLPPHCCGLDCSRLKNLEYVQHYRFKPGFFSRMKAEKFVLLSGLSDVAWNRWGPTLMRLDVKSMRRDRLTVTEPQSEKMELGFELDLRGTGIENLEPLANLPIRQLHIDTYGGTPLDLSPLRRIETLRVLNLKKAHVKELRPAFPLKGLESLTVNAVATDTHLLATHPTLEWVGFEYETDHRRANLPVKEFFIPADHATLDRNGLLYEESFDNFSRGAGDWSGVDREGRPLHAMWTATFRPGHSRGGGYLRYWEQGSDGHEAFYTGPPKLVEALKTAGGGVFEYRFRQNHTGGLLDLSTVELSSDRGRLIRKGQRPPELAWTSVWIPLRQDGMWHLGSLEGELAENEEIQEVLLNLEDILIRAEHSENRGEDSGLDDVRVWARSVANRRTNEIVKQENLRGKSLEWIEGGKVVSDDTRYYAWEKMGMNYTIVNGGCFMELYEGRDATLLLHPITNGRGPARVTFPAPMGTGPGATMRFEAKGSGVDPGVQVKVVVHGEVLIDQRVDGHWRKFRFELPDDMVKAAQVEIEVWPIEWNFEYCYLSGLHIEPAPNAVPSEND